MDPEQLFLHKLEDLADRCKFSPGQLAEGDEYRILMASPLLRDLLLTKPTLVDQVNRKHRLKITYRCVPAERLPAELPTPAFHSSGLSFGAPEMVRQDFVRELPLSAFLAARVAEIQEQSVSVRDLIDYVANAQGAVHYGSKNRSKRNRKVVDEFNGFIRLNGWQPALYSLIAVGRVVCVALEPLAEAVREDQA